MAHIKLKNGKEFYNIRIYEQELCFDWGDNEGLNMPKKYINQTELLKDLKSNGLEIITYFYNSFSGFYQLEVMGNYLGKIKIEFIN